MNIFTSNKFKNTFQFLSESNYQAVQDKPAFYTPQKILVMLNINIK
jgi:hypothetical protein